MTEAKQNEIREALEAQQKIQMMNPSTLKAWIDASVEMKRLANLLTDGKTKDAWGR